MPHAVVDKIADALNSRRKSVNGSSVLIAGVAYKRNIDDTRESPALDVMALLHAKGARLSYADPYVARVAARHWPVGYDLQAVDLTRGTLWRVDCVAVLTDHGCFDYDTIVAFADLVVDTRHAITGSHPHVFRLGAPPRPPSIAESGRSVGVIA
jgi:UDP-N-acetyl-D-glucosamine dehydrogenase